jgi:hypothetical protein
MNQSDRHGGIDPAALAAASLAAALGALAPPGPYAPTSVVIGATILCLIFSYDIDPHRSKAQSFAFGAVVGLIAMLVLGFPFECVFAADPASRLSVLLRERPNDLPHSEVPPIATLLGWLSVSILVYWNDRRRAIRQERLKQTLPLQTT